MKAQQQKGKSVMISDIVTQALSHKIPIVVLDYQSTFQTQRNSAKR